MQFALWASELYKEQNKSELFSTYKLESQEVKPTHGKKNRGITLVNVIPVLLVPALLHLFSSVALAGDGSGIVTTIVSSLIGVAFVISVVIGVIIIL